MQIQREPAANGDLVLHFSGEMDAVGCSRLRPALEELATDDDSAPLVIDLSRVTFLDSSGIGAIVFLYKRLRARGRELSITNVGGQPGELIRLLRIDTAIPVQWDATLTTHSRHAG